MTDGPLIDVCCYGDAAIPPMADDIAGNFRWSALIEADLAAASGISLARMLQADAAPWIAVADSRQLAANPPAVSGLLELARSRPPAVSGLHVSGAAEEEVVPGVSVARVLGAVPPHLRALAARPEQLGIVLLRRDDLLDLLEQEPADESEPADEAAPKNHGGLWSLVVDLVRNGASVHLLTSGDWPPVPKLTTEGGTAPAWLRQRLLGLTPGELVPETVSPADAGAVLAGLLQLHDLQEECHSISQSAQGDGRRQSSDCWHMIVHRREPDYGNATYWCRQFGTHPATAGLTAPAIAILEGCDHPDAVGWSIRLTSGEMWHATEFVDCCRQAVHSGEPRLVDAIRRIQWIEMLLLLGESYSDAIRS